MNNLAMNNIDEITMRLTHYFITKENYQPIIVNGTNNEIWLENTEKRYSVIRINGNYIHNNEQFEYDMFKTKSIVKQIKKKTFSYGSSTLNILLNVGENVNNVESNNKIDVEIVDKLEYLTNGESISSIFPEIKNDVIEADTDMDFFINIANDINEKTEKKNRLYEKTFKEKRIIITYALMAINVIIYVLSNILGILDINQFSMHKAYILNGEYYRLITAAFFHVDTAHLLCNMYSLYIVGTQLENVLGKTRFVAIYFISALTGCLMSGAVNGLNGSAAVGASGAIFGLMGAMLYFGYHYRLYLGNAIKTQIVPVILINLFLGFAMPGIDNFGHIGGLVGGLFATMMVGIEGKTDRSDSINGIILSSILVVFLTYMLLFR